MRWIYLSLVFLASLLQAAPLRVGVSVLPLESIVREIGGDRVEVQSLQREGDSCSVFEPRPSSITWLAGAAVFFRTGVGYESVIMEKIGRQFPELRVADLREAVPLLSYGEQAHHHHGHGACDACGSHSGEETDPHIWLDPVRLAAMADFIAVRLAEARPDEAGEFRKGAEAFKERAGKLDEKIAGMLSPYRGKAFYIYHPALNYFADRYGLKQVPVASPNQAPTVRELHRLTAQAKREGVKTIFIQPQESRKQAEILAAAVGASVVEIDPMDPDWEQNLLQIANALAIEFRRD